MHVVAGAVWFGAGLLPHVHIPALQAATVFAQLSRVT